MDTQEVDWVEENDFKVQRVQENLQGYKYEEHRGAMESMFRTPEHIQLLQTDLQVRNRHLLEENLWNEHTWPGMSVLIMVIVAFVQVYAIRRLFHAKQSVEVFFI